MSKALCKATKDMTTEPIENFLGVLSSSDDAEINQLLQKPVLLASVADKARLEQLLYTAFETKLRVRICSTH